MNTQMISSPNYSAPTKRLFYKIKDVAQLTGVKPYVLRYWESEFPELAPEKDASDQRRYRAKDIETVQAIRKLLYEDRFTIQGARKQLRQELKQTAQRMSAPVLEMIETPVPMPIIAEEVAPPSIEAPVLKLEKAEVAKGMKPVNLYTRALAENLSLLRKEILETLEGLQA